MAKAVVLTAVAEADLEHIVSYIVENWGEAAGGRFLDRFGDIIDLISDSPTIFPLASRSQNVRKCVLTSQNIIFYREMTSRIEVLTIFDTRQDPEKLSVFL